LQNKFLNLLGLCRKAGMLSLGFSKAKDSIQRQKTKIIFLAADVSKKTEKELRFASQNQQIEIIRTIYPIFEFSSGLDMKAGVAAVEDSGFAKALKEKLEGGNLI